LLLVLGVAALAAEKPEVPVVDAHLGSCSADFTVRDGENKAIYGAKITVLVRYGMMGFRKMELQVGTNSEGKARVDGLPERARQPLEFAVSHGGLSKTVKADTAAKCIATFEVTLGPG